MTTTPTWASSSGSELPVRRPRRVRDRGEAASTTSPRARSRDARRADARRPEAGVPAIGPTLTAFNPVVVAENPDDPLVKERLKKAQAEKKEKDPAGAPGAQARHRRRAVQLTRGEERFFVSAALVAGQLGCFDQAPTAALLIRRAKPPTALFGGIDHGAGLGFPADVAGKRLAACTRLLSVRLEAGRRRRDARRIAARDEARACPTEKGGGDRPAKAVRAAGDESCLSERATRCGRAPAACGRALRAASLAGTLALQSPPCAAARRRGRSSASRNEINEFWDRRHHRRYPVQRRREHRPGAARHPGAAAVPDWNNRWGSRTWGRRPRQAIAGPKVMLINFRSGSDSEVTPLGFRQLGLGRIVGNTTAAAVIATGSYGLINGGSIRTPGSLVVTYDPTKPNNYGINLENYGVNPGRVGGEHARRRAEGVRPRTARPLSTR